MGRNVFVSYKFGDSNVKPLKGEWSTTARSYVNEIERLLAYNGHAYYGEHQDEDLSYCSDEQIYERLKNKIFPTSCTIVLISPNMREKGRLDKSQWIPWEIYYSLRETTRNNFTSRRNAILAVVLPDLKGSYEYAISHKQCCPAGCTGYHTSSLFTILKENMFNPKNPSTRICGQNDKIWYGEFSYIPMVRWDYFKDNIDACIERAERIKDNAENYDLHVNVNQ